MIASVLQLPANRSNVQHKYGRAKVGEGERLVLAPGIGISAFPTMTVGTSSGSIEQFAQTRASSLHRIARQSSPDSAMIGKIKGLTRAVAKERAAGGCC